MPTVSAPDWPSDGRWARSCRRSASICRFRSIFPPARRLSESIVEEPMTNPVRVAIALIPLLFGPAARGLANYIQTENAKAGTTAWKITSPGYATGAIEGYASLTSVNRGGRIQFFVNTKDPSYTMDVFRIGYYNGLGGRRMLPTITRTGTVQPPCPTDSLGTVECRWTNPYTLDVPN